MIFVCRLSDKCHGMEHILSFLLRIRIKLLMPVQQQIEDFFKRYAASFNRALTDGVADVDSVTNSFAEHFIEASPFGVIAGKNDSTFREVIPKGWAFYKEIGIQSMNIRSTEIVMLDELHAMTKVRWTSRFVKKDKVSGKIDFEVIYLVQIRQEGVKIFAYITGDEQKALKEHGLLNEVAA